MSDTVQAGDRVLLTLGDGKTFMLRLSAGKCHSTHKGAFHHDAMIGKPWGSTMRTSSGGEAYVLKPRWIDNMMKVNRRTNIMYPKEVVHVLAALGVGSGSRVVEIGTGSGAMTMALAYAVMPGGAVFTYDRRPEFSELAQANCATAGFDAGIEFRTRDVGDELESDVDAVFTDVPEPWAELDVIQHALRGGGRFAAGTPTYNQAETLAVGLDAGGFAMIETVEILHREILARAGKTRPAHRMVGHTQLLTTAVKVIPPVEEPAVEQNTDDGPRDGDPGDDQTTG